MCEGRNEIEYEEAEEEVRESHGRHRPDGPPDTILVLPRLAQ